MVLSKIPVVFSQLAKIEQRGSGADTIRVMSFVLLVLATLAPVLPVDSLAAQVRYFAVWSYVENAPGEELDESALARRTLGYWELHFGSEGEVVKGVYRNADGRPWLVLRYVEENDRIYADLFLPDGSFIVRKSTRLTSRTPDWPKPDRG